MIRIRGAREHNLQDIDIDIGDGLTVITGVSGSGKTSLAFDTLYHEARRRFLEIYSLGSAGLRLSPADVDRINGMGPAMAVGQNLLNRNPNSTLATACGLHPFLRLLYANFGERYCPSCGAGLSVLTEDEIVERLVSLSTESPVILFAPLMRSVPGSHRTLLDMLANQFGVEALHIDGSPWNSQPLDPKRPHDIDLKLDQLPEGDTAAHIRQIVLVGASLGANAIAVRKNSELITLSQSPVCVDCGAWFGDLEPVHFNYACPLCEGEGCEVCDQTGMHPQAAAVRWRGLRLPDLLSKSVDETAALYSETSPSSSAQRLHVEITRRLEALQEVGLGYISLDRPSPTLSRGEAQRVRLAVTLTSRLEDMLHVLDEPTIGQHPADVARLLPAFRKLAGPVVYVEHDRVAASGADQAIDLGPGAGIQGGRLLFSGAPSELWESDTPTGLYFSMRERVTVPEPRPEAENFLTVHGANLRNLRNIDIPIPLSRLTVVTGVSGSGKSTFVEDVLVASLKDEEPVGCKAIEGPTFKTTLVNQSPIGRNPRSNPATYTKLSDIIRDLYANATGLSASHFSFNRPEGACPTCKGMGAVEVAMRYLPSTWIPCSNCEGKRYSDEVLAACVPFGEDQLSIADFYKLSVSDAASLLIQEERLPIKRRRAAQRILEAMRDVGLGYLQLGQPSPTLSGGEAQRVKLARYLGGRSLTKQLLLLDEPSTGLHPQDLSGLLIVLDRLVRAGATIVVVEHNTDVIRAADWIVDLGPGAGPRGGRLLYAGPPPGLMGVSESITAKALRFEDSVQPDPGDMGKRDRRPSSIKIHGARAHNLKNVDVEFPKGALTVVTGVSGSGKSSLVNDVLVAEARRRFLETLSLYERQGTREGPEAPVDSVNGLGVAIAVEPGRRRFSRRATVGIATEISHHLAVLLATMGERACTQCGTRMVRGDLWRCPACQATAPIARPRHFSPRNYAAACLQCHGVGTLQVPQPEKLIIHPEKPLCDGAMYSPGFFPKGYLCKPYNHGYYIVKAIIERYGFDPATTPWNQLAPEAQYAFLYGDPEPVQVTTHSRTGRISTRTITYPGFYGWVRDWDVGGTYTDTVVCPDCQGARLRPEYLVIMLGEHNIQHLYEMTLSELARIMGEFLPPEGISPVVGSSLHTIQSRLGFLLQVGLGYLHLNRITGTLSAGEAQRVKLAGLLGSGLTSLTVMLDEPSRGLHPSEVNALLWALTELRDEGNTVIVVEHDPVIIQAADHITDLGPGAGVAGGEVVFQGNPEQVVNVDSVTAAWMRGERRPDVGVERRQPRGWLTIHGARGNNLRGEEIRLPMGTLTGVCGVSGSGKSTLMIDTLGRALAPKKHTTSVASEPLEPAEHDAIEGAPARIILVDQSRQGVRSPLAFFSLSKSLRTLYAASDDARALGIDEKGFNARCSLCKGRGEIRIQMGFLPDVLIPCETCQGSGHIPEVWEVNLHGLALPEVYALTLDEVYANFQNQESITRPLQAARRVGLGYLTLRQPGYALSGGEAQRMKIAKELSQKTPPETLYILDEPTVGQHMEDVQRLVDVLHRLVEDGGSAVVIEHHPHVLAACDWVVELGPGGGPDGGLVIATGTPETLAKGSTPTAPYLREVLEDGR
jgi:excinuclease ABC subunit A